MGSTIRFVSLTFSLFVVAFLGMKWLLMVRPLTPDPRLPTFHHVDPSSATYKYEQSFASDNDQVRDRLRHEVLDYAKALGDDPCNKVLKAHYIKAVTDYARAWLSIAHCVGMRTCRQSDDASLDRAQQAFGSPLDHRVRETMRNLHETVMFGIGDFPDDTAILVAQMADDAMINPRASEQGRKMAEQFRHPASCFGVPN